MVRLTKHLAVGLAGFALSCGGAEEPSKQVAHPSSSAFEPVRSYAFPCNAKLGPLSWFSWTPGDRTLLVSGSLPSPGAAPAPEDSATAHVHAWSLDRAELQFTFETGAPVGEFGLVVGFAADGRIAVSAGTHHASPSTVVAWDLASGRTTVLGPGVSYPEAIAASNDGRLIAMLGGSDEVLTVDVDQMSVLRPSPDAGQRISGNQYRRALRFASGGLVLLHQTSQALYRRDSHSLEVIDTFAGVSRMTNDGSSFVILTETTAALYDANTGRLERALDLSAEERGRVVRVVGFSPSGDRLAIELVGNLVVFDRGTGAVVARVPEPASSRSQWSGDGRALLAGTEIWNTSTWTSVVLPNDVSLRSGNGHLADRFEDDTLVELDGLTLEPTGRRWTLSGHPEQGFFMGRYQFTQDGQYIAYANTSGDTIRLVRTSDHAIVDLGVALIEGAWHGFAATPEGGYEGPEAAAGCAPKTGRGRRAVSGLLKRFVAGEPLE